MVTNLKICLRVTCIFNKNFIHFWYYFLNFEFTNLKIVQNIYFILHLFDRYDRYDIFRHAWYDFENRICLKYIFFIKYMQFLRIQYFY